MLAALLLLLCASPNVRVLYKFDVTTNSWRRVKPVEKLEAGLYSRVVEANGVVTREALFVGMKCNDVRLAPPVPKGHIATCVPGERSATAMYVPDPALLPHR